MQKTYSFLYRVGKQLRALSKRACHEISNGLDGRRRPGARPIRRARPRRRTSFGRGRDQNRYGRLHLRLSACHDGNDAARDDECRAAKRQPRPGWVSSTTRGPCPDAHSFRDITAPNADTLYSTAWLNVSKEPYILGIPDQGDRYYLMPILSGAGTDVFPGSGQAHHRRQGSEVRDHRPQLEWQSAQRSQGTQITHEHGVDSRPHLLHRNAGRL